MIPLEISPDFPQNMTDKQIQANVKIYMSEIVKSGSQENIVMRCYPLIALGQNELQKRQNDRLTKITLTVSFVSLAIAAIALCMTFQNTSSSDRWEQRQIISLDALQIKLDSINQHLQELVATNKASKQAPKTPH